MNPLLSVKTLGAKKVAVKAVTILVILSFSAYGIQQAAIAAHKAFNNAAVAYVLDNNLLSKEQGVQIIKEVPVVTGSVDDITSKVGSQINEGIKSNLK